MQVEDSRGDWLWRMIQALGATERFRVPLLHALYDLADERSARQLCELARHYAEMEDASFRTRLYEIVERRPFAEDPSLAEEEIIALDGEQGFLFAVRVRGQDLAGREWQWHNGSFIHLAVERFGEEHVDALLGASADAAVGRFREGWRREKQSERVAKPASHTERMAAPV